MFRILNIAPIRLAFRVDWAAIEEDPEYAGDIFQAIRDEVSLDGWQTEIGYRKVYGGGAIFDEIEVDRTPYIFDSIIKLKGEPRHFTLAEVFGETVSEEHGIPDELFDIEVSATEIEVFLYGSDLGAIQTCLLVDADAPRMLFEKSGVICLNIARFLAADLAAGLNDFVSAIRRVEKRFHSKDSPEIFMDARFSTRSLKAVHFDTKDPVVWNHRYFFAESPEKLKTIRNYGLAPVNGDRLKLVAAEGITVQVKEGRSLVEGSYESFRNHELDRPLRTTQILYGYIDGVRMYADRVSGRLARSKKRRDYLKEDRDSRHIIRIRDYFEKQWPLLETSFKDPRKPLVKSYLNAFDLAALKEAMEKSVDTLEATSKRVGSYFAEKTSRRSELALQFLSFLGLFGLLHNLLWFAKGGFDPGNESGFFSSFSILNSMTQVNSESFLVLSLTLTVLLAIYLVRR